MERIENKKQVKKAMILAGGLGTRFLPATLCLAKELFPIGNKPIIMYHIEDLVKAGINDILIVGNKLKQETKKSQTSTAAKPQSAQPKPQAQPQPAAMPKFV